MSKYIIVLGSSRSDGNTYRICNYFIQQYSLDMIDLNPLNISYYDYEHKNEKDDFLPTIKKLLEYDGIIFASPIYWYSMSGIMKVFFDRFTDVLTIQKEQGRKLRGKSMAVMSCSGDDEPAASFYTPFELSAGYLGMPYLGSVHAYTEGTKISPKIQHRLNAFYSRLMSTST